jgi:histidinol-phosphatase (PHP family)
MVKANYHTHHELCNHAGGTTEDYAKSAIKNGFVELGMSDHVPSRLDILNVDKYRMEYSELPIYYNDVRTIQKAYADKIKIYLGLECEYLDPNPTYYEEFLAEVDYLILGQHYIIHDGEYVSTFGLSKPEHLITYANDVKKALETGYFTMFAHPDIYMCGYDTFDEAAAKAAHIIGQTAEATGIPLEFNANGIRRGVKQTSQGVRYPYPRQEFWEIVRDYNVKIILNSDAHNPALLYDEAMMEAEQRMKEWGLTAEPFLTIPKK